MTYERLTPLSIEDALALAEEILCERIPLRKEAADAHSIRLGGGDGTATIRAHRHGLDTHIDVRTDQLRTSRLDNEVQYFLTMLPYQPGEVRGGGTALPGGLSLRRVLSLPGGK